MKEKINKSIKDNINSNEDNIQPLNIIRPSRRGIVHSLIKRTRMIKRMRYQFMLMI